MSENASMARLKNDIIKKSPLNLLEPSRTITNFNSKSKKPKIQTIYRFALDTRGGADSDYEYKLAERIQDLVIKLAFFFKKNELKAKILKIIYTQGRLFLQLVLSLCKINLQYVVIEAVNPQVVVIACCIGGTTGFVSSWFSVAAILLAPPTLLSVFLLRSLDQQIHNNAEYTKFKQNIGRLFKDKNFQENIETIFIETQNNIKNSKKIKLEHLNWNKDPAVKEAAERLGIFKNAPSDTGPLTLDTLDPDPDLKKILQEFGLIETPNPKTPIKTSPKGKMVNFRDFVDGMVDGDNKSDLDVIDAEIVKESVRIRIRD